MAAGMGSRFGGLKQIEGVGPSGETIMEYSVYDAIRSGFDEVVFIIRKDFEDDFRKKIVEKIQDKIPVQLVYQDLKDLPEGYSVPVGRIKPWGTGHAILSACNKVKKPFVVINADDFYGLEAFTAGINFLKKQNGQILPEYGLVGYALENTLSKHGAVTRAQCITNNSGMLTYIEEIHDIRKTLSTVAGVTQDGNSVTLSPGTIVSMNIWCFLPVVFEQLAVKFRNFLDNQDQPDREFLIPSVVNELVQNDEALVRVLESNARWAGITYKEDVESVKNMILDLTGKGIYPENLWK